MIEKKCPICHKIFYAKESDIARGWAKCCSKSCAAKLREKKHKKKAEAEERKRRKKAIIAEKKRRKEAYAAEKKLRKKEAEEKSSSWKIPKYEEPISMQGNYVSDMEILKRKMDYLKEMEQYKFFK